MRKQEKPIFVENLAAELKSASSAVLVNFSGMNVAAQQDLKKSLAKAGGKMLVVKNTLLKLAGKKADYPENVMSDEVLEGQTALIIGEDDAVSPIQALGKFIGEASLPEIKVGVVEGVYYDRDGVVKLSKLPSKEVLYGQVVGGISAPLYGLVGTLNSNLQKLVYVLSIASKGGER